jgi:hypothetical protein
MNLTNAFIVGILVVGVLTTLISVMLTSDASSYQIIPTTPKQVKDMQDMQDNMKTYRTLLTVYGVIIVLATTFLLIMRMESKPSFNF